jgi:3-dehydroquinate dehydratase
MKLSRLGSFHQSKLSFLRSFLSEFKDWEYKRDLFNLDHEGFGEAVYSFKKKDRVYSLVCFANAIKDEERSDRVIATKWDAAFTLHDGIPSKDDISRLKNEVPKQEVGRLSFKELTLSRANKSLRVFNHVVECLSEGKQPDLDLLSKVGYLYRTTAVYGSGKFGLADRFRIKNREEINGPFRLEMMLVYLVRQFTFDQVNHVAHYKNPKKAVKLNEQICKNLGIGNSTGLGMAPFIVNHPTLLNNWILSREKALKKIREIRVVDYYDSELFMDCVKKSLKNITTWNTESEYQKNKIKSLLKDVQKFIKFIENDFDFKTEYPFNEIYLWLEKNTCDECIEYIVSIMMEPYDNITKPLVANMSSDEDKYFNIPTDRTIQELKLIIQSRYPNILDINFDKKENNENFWFISKNKEEPRLANRFEEHGSELEQPLAIARDIKKLYQKLLSEKNDITIAQFLSKNSELRHVVRRAFIIEKFPYAEIQDNTIGKNIIPIDMLRLKLSFFGALKFDPRSDKWLRICMFQGAPLPSELKTYDEQWVYKANS